MRPDADDLILAEIQIKQGLDKDGNEYWATNFSDRRGNMISLIVGLGLLEAAKIDLMQRHGCVPLPPGQEDVDDDS